MVEVDARLAKGGYDSKHIIQVHDELVALKVNAASAANWQDL